MVYPYSTILLSIYAVFTCIFFIATFDMYKVYTLCRSKNMQVLHKIALYISIINVMLAFCLLSQCALVYIQSCTSYSSLTLVEIINHSIQIIIAFIWARMNFTVHKYVYGY